VKNDLVPPISRKIPEEVGDPSETGVVESLGTRFAVLIR
jgi:hypothetical protein